MGFKKVFKSILFRVPTKIRYRIFRSLIHLSYKELNDFEFKIAETKEELEQAFQLLYRAYTKTKLQEPNPYKMRVTIYHALPTTTTLVIKRKDKVVGTLSLIADNVMGLPCEKATSLKKFRDEGLRLAEVSALAIDDEYKGMLLFPLLKFMYEYVSEFFGIDILIATITTPKNVHQLYEALLSFKPISDKEVNDYSFSNFVPVVVEYLDLREAKSIFWNLYNAKKNSLNLFYYFVKHRFKSFNFPKRDYFLLDDPVMNKELFDYFFNHRSQILTKLTDLERAKLKQALHPSYFDSKIINFNERKSKTARRSEIRYNVKCKAKFNHSQERFEVLNVSKEGLKIKANEFLPVNTSLTCRILIAEFEVIELTCTTKWNFDEKLYGLKIENSNHPHWLKFINHIENKTWNKNERRAA